MGRCYEFGVAVHGDCEHAMVVSAEGGACTCATCGSRCTGKFSACDAILAQPGRLPQTAPRWAVEGRNPPATATQSRDAGRSEGSQEPSTAETTSVIAVTTDNGARKAAQRETSTAAPVPGSPLAESEAVRALERQILEQAAAVEDMRATVQSLGSQFVKRDAELRATFEQLTDSYRQLAKEVSTLSRRVASRRPQPPGGAALLRRFLEGGAREQGGGQPTAPGNGRADPNGNPLRASAWPNTPAKKA